MEDLQKTVFIVDDEAPILDALTLLLKSVELSVKTFNNAQDFIDAYDSGKPGCLLLDIRMPGISGLELQKHLNQQPYALPIIFMTGHGDIPMAVEAIKNGAEDFIQKPFNSDDLLKKIQAAFDKDKYQRTNKKNSLQFCENIQSLTPREREIMERMIAGDANKVIAIDLGISQRTVEVHRAHIMQKTQAKSLAQLIKVTVVMKQAENSL
ncbi:MAG: FixJ family two-component response regulator [Cellvibrionaceae bacterium]|jgi:FixJ family two-component response regulator